MKTLEFADRLVEGAFVSNNNYVYNELQTTEYKFFPDSNYRPYILRATGLEGLDGISIKYAAYPYQFGSRVLNTKQIKEVMDSARVPITISTKSGRLLAGKGFLARSTTQLLFVACTKGSALVTQMSDITFVINRVLWEDENKSIATSIKDFIKDHPGDIIMTYNMEKYIGSIIRLPGNTDSEYTKNKEKLLKEVIKTAKVTNFV